MSRFLMIPILVALCLLTGCDSEAPRAARVVQEATPPHQAKSAQEIKVVGPERPGTCGPRVVGEFISRFFAAANGGRPDVSEFFARDMEWYSVTDRTRNDDRRHFVSYGYDPEKLGTYFERRAEQNEELTLLEVEVQHDPSRQNTGHIAYSLERRADDLDDSQPFAHGKGAVDCDSGRIKVWSMAHPLRLNQPPGVCPGRAGPPRVALACVRE